MNKTLYGTTSDGTPVHGLTLTNGRGCRVDIIEYGASVVSVSVPDRKGRMGDVVLGFGNLGDYVRNPCFIGGTIGRYGNRIAKARFELNGVAYELGRNNGPNHLHGGFKGFHTVVWKILDPAASDDGSVTLAYTSRDGEEGYPGTLSVRVTFRLTDDNALRIDYRATTDRDTVVNLTNHSYFNLAGEGNGDILGHRMQIHADAFTPVDDTLIPTGEIRSVAGTPFDFRTPTAVGGRIEHPDDQIRLGGGYDHNFVLNRSDVGLTPAASVLEPSSGRTLEIRTTEPGLQFYSGNFLDGSLTGISGKPYGRRTGFCLETQHFPDSPNRPEFPSTRLQPGQVYTSATEYRFGIA
jgi:aldose 1-epimerase